MGGISKDTTLGGRRLDLNPCGASNLLYDISVFFASYITSIVYKILIAE